jgi:RimJ/RimL family protein N-acetyltransferase
MKVLETERLILRKLNGDDAAFYLRLVNEPSWLQFIGDRGIRTVEEARATLLSGPVAMYESHGFGFYMVELKDGAVPIGMCGLIKRESLADVDIGYAFLPEFWGKGYAYEAASAVLEYGNSVCGLQRIVAITSPDNHQSIKLLEKIGLKFEAMLQLKNDGSETKLFACQF